MKKSAVLMAASLLFFAACSQDKKEDSGNKTEQKQEAANTQTPPPTPPPSQTVDPQEQARVDGELIKKFVEEKKLNAKSTESGIFYVIEKEGKGKNPTLESTVKVHYAGTLLDGTKFDSSYDRGEPTEFPLRGVIRGWQEGIPLFKPGGKGKIIIPSGLAYGPRQVGPNIPANSVLVFDIELLEVK